MKKMKSGKTGLFALIAIIIVGLIIISSLIVTVPNGTVAVKYSINGGVQDEIYTQGWHFKSPSVKTTEYSIGLKQSYLTSDKTGDSKDDESFEASSSEGKALKIDLTFSYQYKPENVVSVFKTFSGQDGESIKDSFIKPNIISWTKEVIARYKVSDLLGTKRADANNELNDYLADKFNKYGITISNVSLINIDVDEDTKNAINNKIKAEQEQATQKIKNQTEIDKAEADKTVKETEANRDAEVKRINTEAEAEAKKAMAEADAEATRIKADAEAEKNRKISDSLTDKLIEKNKIDKWSGNYPTYMGNGDSISLIDVN